MDLRHALLDWFARNQRPLPWRKHYRPYEVWISEIMLQQTQVATALPYYERWMKTFPTVEALAKSPEKKVMAAWQGLGYYSRARNLHAAAKTVVDEYGGKFPSDYGAILGLKGIGRYTAGAIASIAFNQERPIVDGNVVRVLARLFAVAGPADQNREAFWTKQEELIPKGRAREFNQSLMELGALVCLPRDPKCSLCPVRAHCKAFAMGKIGEYPAPKIRRKTVRVDAAAVVIEKSGKFFLHRRPEGKIMGGLWEFPEWKMGKDEKIAPAEIGGKAAEEMKKNLGVSAPLSLVGTVKRSYTHHQETLRVYRASGKISPKSEWPSAWIGKADLPKYPLSSAHQKIAKLI